MTYITPPVGVAPTAYYYPYFVLATGPDLLSELQQSRQNTLQYFEQLDPGRAHYRYEAGKWSVQQILRHINDAERILCYRALRFARHDYTMLPGFNQDHYAEHDHHDKATLAQVIAEYLSVRSATLSFYETIAENALDNTASANGLDFSPRLLGWMISGHNRHHLKVLRERYSAA